MISLNGKTEFDYNANYIHFEASPPAAKIDLVEIPLRDGVINASKLLSDTVFYEPRTIIVGLELRSLRGEWPRYYSQLLEDLHGQEIQVERSEDPGWIWEGTAAVGALEDHGASAGVQIEVTAHPYKKRRELIPVFYEHVAGDEEVVMNIPYMRGYPVFLCEDPGFTVTYNNETWPLTLGESTAYGMWLPRGESSLFLHGTGAVKVSYRGGEL